MKIWYFFGNEWPLNSFVKDVRMFFCSLMLDGGIFFSSVCHMYLRSLWGGRRAVCFTASSWLQRDRGRGSPQERGGHARIWGQLIFCKCPGWMEWTMSAGSPDLELFNSVRWDSKYYILLMLLGKFVRKLMEIIFGTCKPWLSPLKAFLRQIWFL